MFRVRRLQPPRVTRSVVKTEQQKRTFDFFATGFPLRGYTFCLATTMAMEPQRFIFRTFDNNNVTVINSPFLTHNSNLSHPAKAETHECNSICISEAYG